MINIYIAHYNHYFFEKSIKDVGDEDDIKAGLAIGMMMEEQTMCIY